MPTGNRIFVSSTVYDLIDVRSEVETLVRSLGFMPVMSDSKSEGFDTSAQTNSIETCLSNLRTCSAVILILSQRYGPSLRDHGFSDHSATHLEYLEAKKHNIPVYFFVRDRLNAEYSIWKKSSERDKLKLSWIDKRQMRIFDFIEEHSKLGTASNWYSQYTDSIDIKNQLKTLLKVWSDKITFWADVHENKVPIVFPSHDCEQIGNKPQWKLKQNFKNCGSVPMIDITMTVISSGAQEKEIIIPPGEALSKISLIDSSIPVQKTEEIELEYKDTKGRRYKDLFKGTITGGPTGIRTGLKLVSKKYLDENGLERAKDS